jgi:hypothetical protein
MGDLKKTARQVQMIMSVPSCISPYTDKAAWQWSHHFWVYAKTTQCPTFLAIRKCISNESYDHRALMMTMAARRVFCASLLGRENCQ